MIKSGKAENRQTTHGLAFFYFFQQKFSFFPCQFFSINVKPLSPFFFLINLFISHLTVFTDHLDHSFVLFFSSEDLFFPCQLFSINVKPLSPFFFFLINLFISHLTVFTDHLDQIFSTSKIANLLLLLGVKGAGSLEP